MKKLVIVESPAKAKTIAKYLGKEFKVEASMGHVRDLPKSDLGVDIENGFVPKYINIRGKADVINKLKKYAQEAEKVYLATDPDREGEAISWHLATILGLDTNDNVRITFNEITKKAVQESLKNARPIDQNLVNAQQARRILDRLVGYKLSPFLWEKVKGGLSAGRVQSVATRLVVEREEEIENFKPEEYWTLEAVFKKDVQEFKAKFYGDKKGKIELKNQDHVQKIEEKIKNKEFKVVKIKVSEKKKNPPPPFITSTLQQEASRKLRFTPAKTMAVAQMLYEGVEIKGEGSVGLITYMRTDSTRVSEEAQQAARSLIVQKFGKEYLPEKPRVYKTKKDAQDAHEAIRPTYLDMDPESIKDSLTLDQYKLYKLIYDRFLASQMESSVYEVLSAELEVEGYIFKLTGSKLKFAGFMEVYVEGKDTEDEEEENQLPEIREGEALKPIKLESKQHFTQPPSRYTEATLIKALEENGIGRPSTYAPTIQTILERGYVAKEDRFLKPTELGRIVTNILKEYFKDIIDIEFTAELESNLDKIEEGKLEWTEVVKKYYQPLEKELEIARATLLKVKVEDEETDIVCENCGRKMVIKKGRYGKFLACPGYPECKNTKPYYDYLDVLCPKCGKRIIEKKSKKGKRYYTCEGYPDCDLILWEKPVKNCPKCGSLMFEKGKKGNKKLVCSNENCAYQEKTGEKGE
ncbi:DNA topoisomerase-1 [Caldicellulosiruptor bescii]|uniref:DNA topoisomerase 1 n=2 Tax=Caldicellulosiruptor bescii TaxID=31899 RepID=B9MM33_CALBD|nr:type I DNA topoisomerase [Caldicellulosiruptor bescii]ACM61256.1 DNA topoisomerase I [Caldicellulosiruptor bescii DSM 6725]PBC88931.1 DNA topoisomerase-1 [Caldicellulosiruptor bescii]PBC91587.1 DNA topoisomerase-1 [Caldicellulosiruptor bescii]PBD03000.1 DNA topoisomerase-1 [Caldicellulosiruptor bescii]PBD07384.1 DNA topoisomerase-1 [Caldicellulosiruptor bescii]